MSKITLNSTFSGYASTALLNSNFTTIQAAMDNTLSRDGTSPNQMNALIDMNSNRIINLGAPVNPNDAARLMDIPGSLLPNFLNVPLPGHQSVLFGDVGLFPATTAISYVNMAKNVSNTGSNALLNLQLYVTAATVNGGEAENDAVLALCATSASNVSDTSVVGGVAVNGTSFIDGGASLGACWGGLFSANVVGGSTGSPTGIEIDLSIPSTANQQPNHITETSSTAVVLTNSMGLLIGNINPIAHCTAGIVLTPTITTGGFYFGAVLQGVVTAGIKLRQPLAAGALGIWFEDTAADPLAGNWGEMIRGPRVLTITKNSALHVGSQAVLLSSSAFDELTIGGTNCTALVVLPSVINFNAVVTTPSAPSAGGAGALPATPKGYATFQIAGVNRQIAYY